MPLYWELWFFKWHKTFKQGRENVEDNRCSGRPISSTNDHKWKWCELWWRKTAKWVSGWLQDRQLIMSATKMSWNDFENGSSESEQTLQTTGCCITIMCQQTLRFQFENFWRRNIPVLPHPLYSPDLAPCDFYLFSKLKFKLKGHHFGTVENIQKVVTDELHTLKENDFQYCYDQWKKRNHCVTSKGSYFEGDNL